MLHLFVGKIREAREQHHQIGLVQSFQTAQVRAAGQDVAIIIERKDYRTIKSVMFGQNLSQFR